MRVFVGVVLIVIGILWLFFKAAKMFSDSWKYYQFTEDLITSFLAIIVGVLILLEKISF